MEKSLICLLVVHTRLLNCYCWCPRITLWLWYKISEKKKQKNYHNTQQAQCGIPTPKTTTTKRPMFECIGLKEQKKNETKRKIPVTWEVWRSYKWHIVHYENPLCVYTRVRAYWTELTMLSKHNFVFLCMSNRQTDCGEYLIWKRWVWALFSRWRPSWMIRVHFYRFFLIQNIEQFDCSRL